MPESTPGSRKKKSTTPAKALNGAYMTWLAAVPDDVREAVATRLGENPISTYREYVNFIQAMMVETVRGDIHPEVARVLCEMAEMMLVALSADRIERGPTIAGASHHLVQALADAEAELRKNPIDAAYFEVLPADDAAEVG